MNPIASAPSSFFDNNGGPMESCRSAFDELQAGTALSSCSIT